MTNKPIIFFLPIWPFGNSVTKIRLEPVKPVSSTGIGASSGQISVSNWFWLVLQVLVRFWLVLVLVLTESIHNCTTTLKRVFKNKNKKRIKKWFSGEGSSEICSVWSTPLALLGVGLNGGVKNKVTTLTRDMPPRTHWVAWRFLPHSPPDVWKEATHLQGVINCYFVHWIFLFRWCKLLIFSFVNQILLR